MVFGLQSKEQTTVLVWEPGIDRRAPLQPDQKVALTPILSVRPGSGAFGYTVVVRIEVGL